MKKVLMLAVLSMGFVSLLEAKSCSVYVGMLGHPQCTTGKGQTPQACYSTAANAPDASINGIFPGTCYNLRPATKKEAKYYSACQKGKQLYAFASGPAEGQIAGGCRPIAATSSRMNQKQAKEWFSKATDTCEYGPIPFKEFWKAYKNGPAKLSRYVVCGQAEE